MAESELPGAPKRRFIPIRLGASDRCADCPRGPARKRPKVRPPQPVEDPLSDLKTTQVQETFMRLASFVFITVLVVSILCLLYTNISGRDLTVPEPLFKALEVLNELFIATAEFLR